MRKIIIDTNALISFVTDRNLDQQAKIAELFKHAGQLKTVVYCPQNAITEFVYVLEKIYGQPAMLIRRMVADLIAMPGIEVVHEVDFRKVLQLWPDIIKDYGDALIVATCLFIKDAQIATFDKKLIASIKKAGPKAAVASL